MLLCWCCANFANAQILPVCKPAAFAIRLGDCNVKLCAAESAASGQHLYVVIFLIDALLMSCACMQGLLHVVLVVSGGQIPSMHSLWVVVCRCPGACLVNLN